MKRSNLLALSLALLGTAHAAEVIKLATLSPLSGGQSMIGTQIQNAAKLAAADYRARFKQLGFDVVVIGYDDQADPTTGVANARRIAADKDVLAMVGTYNSGVVIPVSSLLASSNLAIVSPANTATIVTARGLKNMNRVVSRDDDEGARGAEFMRNTLGAKSAYFINDKTTYGEGLAGEAEKTFKKDGGRVVGSEGTEEKNDFSGIISKIKVSRPDVIYFGGIYNQVGVFLRQLRENGVTVPVLGGAGLDAQDLMTIAGNGARNTYFTTPAAPVASNPNATRFAAAYTKTFQAQPQGFSVFAYDAASACLQGILDAIAKNQGKKPSRAQVQDAIRNVSLKGLSGPISFTSTGDRLNPNIYVMAVTDDLKTRLVK